MQFLSRFAILLAIFSVILTGHAFSAEDFRTINRYVTSLPVKPPVQTTPLSTVPLNVPFAGQRPVSPVVQPQQQAYPYPQKAPEAAAAQTNNLFTGQQFYAPAQSPYGQGQSQQYYQQYYQPYQPPAAVTQPQLVPQLLQQPLPGQQLPAAQTISVEDAAANAAAAYPPAALMPEPLSQFEYYVNEMLGWNGTGAPLRQFGYEMFAPVVDMMPDQLSAIAPGYMLVPGDEIRISIWGRFAADYSALIGRDGSVNLADLGVLHLAGLTFSEAREYLEKEFAKYYKTSEMKLNVSLGSLSSIRVFVVGKATRPGSYQLPPMSTVLNALSAAGGPGRNGSMRKIALKRGGKTITELDLYDLLLRGDKTGDLRLQPGDVVFIPSIGNQVAVSGYVRSPGIYELKGEKVLGEVIEMAGGASELAFAGRVRVDRVDSMERKIVSIEATLDGDSNGFKAEPGDIIEVYRAMPDEMRVGISGAVEREGDYGIGHGLTVKDLVSRAGGTKPFAYTEEAELTRITPEQNGPVTERIRISLKKALDGDPEHNLTLRKNDFLFVRSVPEWNLYRKVTVGGEVRFPGVYTVMKGERISSLIERAGGFTGKAYLKGAIFTRESVKAMQQMQLNESIDRLETDLTAIYTRNVESSMNTDEGKLMQESLMKRSSFLKKLRSVEAKGRVTIELSDLTSFTGSESDLLLEDNDYLYIPETPSQVQVMGSVTNQTAFVYRKGSSVSDYIKLAGGVTKAADTNELYILKVDGTAVKRGSDSWIGWDSEKMRWVGGGIMHARLDPGDTVVVPEQIDTSAVVRDVKDITQILYQIAVTAGVLIIAF